MYTKFHDFFPDFFLLCKIRLFEYLSKRPIKLGLTMDMKLLLMLSSFLYCKNLRCFCVRQRDPDDDDRPSIIVMWRLIGKVVVDYFFCGYAPFIGAWQPALFRFAACLPATRRALGGARSFSFLLSLLAFVDVKTRRCHRSTRPSCETFHTP